MIERFVEAARTYCACVERAGTLTVPDRLFETRLRLGALYAAALELPAKPDCGDDIDNTSPLPPPLDLGPHDDVVGTLAEDVLEVYVAVARGLALWDRGHSTEAIWQWRFGFDTHWGSHAVDGLRALHQACSAV